MQKREDISQDCSQLRQRKKELSVNSVPLASHSSGEGCQPFEAILCLTTNRGLPAIYSRQDLVILSGPGSFHCGQNYRQTVSVRSQDLAEEQKKPKCRIVVADDNADSAASLAMMLRILGHEVQTAHDGQQAVELAETFRPDVMLLDIGMPRMDGYEAAQHLRKNPELGRVILIALTGWGQDDDKRRAEEAGFNHHVTKPIDLAALQSLLKPLNCDQPEHVS